MHSLALLVLLVANAQAPRATVSGTVRDATGLALPGATVQMSDALVAVSDAAGAFELSLPVGSHAVVRVSLPGFETQEVSFDVRADARLDVVLAVGRVQDRVTVTARDRDAAIERTFTVDPLLAYRTPGAQTDLLRTLQSLPGVAAPDDAAGLFVRGGDVSEVLFTMDDAVIAHPYRYETPTGGFRGAVDPLFVTGLSFSTGGFSARYGNALSAIVDMRGLEPPAAPQLTGTLGLAAASASVAWPVTPGFGLRGAANRTFTRLLFAVNGSPRHFDPPPDGWDGSAGLTWNLGRLGRVKGFVLRQHDQVGVDVEQDAFVGLLHSSSSHLFGGGRWDGTVARWTASASIGADTYERTTTTGILDVGVTDRVGSWRIDLTPPRDGRIEWRLGGNGSVSETTIAGAVPTRGGDLAGVGGASRFDVAVDDWFGGVFTEATTTAGRIGLTAGARVDRFGHADATRVDPRVNVRVALGLRRAIRLASGIYHQAPAASYYDRSRGAARLAPMQAVHYVAGYETGRESEGLYFRAETYLKKYTKLPLESRELGYVSEGYGSAHGLDVFGRWLSSSLEIRGSASWLYAHRRWSPIDQRERYDLPMGTWPADFEIPWSAQLVANVPVGHGVSVGASLRSAAGRPHTPIVGSVPSDEGRLPVFGALNSERLPRYERADVSASWLVPAASGVAIFFASMDNVLGRDNFFGYVYAPDYSSRRPAPSAAPRSIFVGMTYRR